MQIDMHYYGTYAMARAAGLKKDPAKIIATAAQFVDDNAEKESINFRDGGRMDAEATAHHAFDRKNIDLEDQRKIWVPFHFLPGNEGNSYTERLVCRSNSQISADMVAFNLSLNEQPYALPLMGITAHVYADTFAHYGFSGISSRRNKVINDSFKLYELDSEMEKYVHEKAENFRQDYHKETGILANVKSWFAETLSGALGHGAVATYPDRPYLVWQFEYEDPKYESPVRNNPETFLQGCEGLYQMFRKFAQVRPDLAEQEFAEFNDIKNVVSGILKVQAPKKGRIKAWQDAANGGKLFASGAEDIPKYNANKWLNERDNLRREKESQVATDLSIYRYYQAAAIHRIHVLRNLLPDHGLVVA
jgi:hypothetical protein